MFNFEMFLINNSINYSENEYRTTSLLGAGVALAYQTVRCSALNAEELRREGGLESLLEAITRCIPMIGTSSKSEDVAVQVKDLPLSVLKYML